eukprot:485616-Amphidinium_carterae.1
MERDYPFRFWMLDVILWSISTDVAEARQGPLLVMSLGGTARAMAREIAPNILMGGGDIDLDDGSGIQRVTGLVYVLVGLSKRFGPLSEETNVSALADLYGFTRQSHESTDELLARFEVVRHRAQHHSGVALQASQVAWLLLHALRIPPENWVQLLAPFQGQLPRNEPELGMR